MGTLLDEDGRCHCRSCVHQQQQNVFRSDFVPPVLLYSVCWQRLPLLLTAYHDDQQGTD